MPGVKIVIGRIHIAKHYREAADRVRKQEPVRLKSERSKKEYELLKGCLWAFRKDPENLTPEEHQMLQRFFGYSP